MIQKCPNCGQWCETDESGMIQRFGKGWYKSVENAGEIVGGNSVIGNMIGSAIGGNTGIIRGGLKALFGDKYEFTCPNCGYEWGTDDAAEDQTEDYLREQRLNGDDVTAEIDEEIEKFISSEQYKEAVDWLEGLLKDPDVDGYYSHVLRKIAVLNYVYLDDDDATIDACRRGVSLLRDEPWSYDDSFLRYFWYKSTDNLADARYLALMVSQNATSETVEEKSLKDIAWSDFTEFDKKYSDILLQFDYKDRKAIFVTPKYSDLGQSHIDVFTRDRLPKNISLPVGHPIENQIYIGHPYSPEVYLPIETYQYRFVEDRVREFCEIAQTLGATEITVEALNTFNTSRDSSRDRNATGGGSYGVTSINGSGHDHKESNVLEAKYQALNFHQEYSPTEPVHLPEKMVWFQHEPRWQRLHQQRLKGILTHEERIETRNSQVLSGSELKEIKAEVQSVFEANGEWTQSMEEKFVQEENAILSIRVKFAPLSQLTGSTNVPNAEKGLSSSELEYLDEVKFTLSDGEIGPRERKTLERVRMRLGISESRAKEIEASVTVPQLTEEEKEYLEEVKAVLEDGEIGSRERKALERRRVSLGISEERAKDIERIIEL